MYKPITKFRFSGRSESPDKNRPITIHCSLTSQLSILNCFPSPNGAINDTPWTQFHAMPMKLFLLLLVLTGFVLAQKDKDKKDEPWPVDVHVNLLVTDAAQKPVTDLKLGDIKLFENDVAQKVNYLAYKPVSNVAFVIDNSGSVRTQLDLIMRIGVV